MKYPKMNKQPKRTVSVPSLNGGMNLRDSLNMCNDNQLTDSLNMWFRDGVLKTRNGLKEVYRHEYKNLTNISCEGDIETGDTQVHKNIQKVIDGESYTLVSTMVIYRDYIPDIQASAYDLAVIYFYWVGKKDHYPEYAGNLNVKYSENFNYFVCCYKDMLYCFVGGYERSVYKCNSKAEQMLWSKVEDSEIYAPLVMTNCLTHSILDEQEALLAGGATMYEGYNLIGNRYRMKYSTVNKQDLPHTMIYSLLYSTNNHIGSKVIAKHTTKDGTFTHEVTITGKLNKESEAQDDGLLMQVSGKAVTFVSAETGESVWVKEDDYIENNLEIEASCPNDADDFDKVFSMTRCEWYGGTSAGLGGGTRLFLGGNTKEGEQSLILWSGVNDPLYFSKNCSSYVGNSMSAVTAFGKQSDMLVIFKENELYYAKYTQKASTGDDNVINQSENYYAESRVSFPLTQIHSGLGCDCPNTVELCRNRLVWANSDGKVYTLTNDNQFSERNVFEVSEMMYRRIKTEKNLKNAYSSDWDGYYILVADNRIYLMDYNSYGYQYISSYSKTEDANIRIPWYYWELDTKAGKLLSVNNDLYCVSFEASSGLAGQDICLNVKRLDGDTDDGQAIFSMVQTKFFDFGSSNNRKNIERVGITFGNNGGVPITVKYITESGTDYDTVNLTNSETGIRNVGFITSKILSPCIRSAVRFGVRFECEGNMAIEGVNIISRILGEAR